MLLLLLLLCSCQLASFFVFVILLVCRSRDSLLWLLEIGRSCYQIRILSPLLTHELQLQLANFKSLAKCSSLVVHETDDSQAKSSDANSSRAASNSFARPPTSNHNNKCYLADPVKMSSLRKDEGAAAALQLNLLIRLFLSAALQLCVLLSRSSSSLLIWPLSSWLATPKLLQLLDFQLTTAPADPDDLN